MEEKAKKKLEEEQKAAAEAAAEAAAAYIEKHRDLTKAGTKETVCESKAREEFEKVLKEKSRWLSSLYGSRSCHTIRLPSSVRKWGK